MHGGEIIKTSRDSQVISGMARTVRLSWFRRAPAISLVFFQQGLQALHDLRFLAVEVSTLSEIVTKVVEFTGEWIGLVVALAFEPIRLVVAVTATSVNQDPVSLADGQIAVGAVQHRRLTDGRGVLLAEQRRE